MREILIKMIAQKIGLNAIPKTQKEFFNLAMNNLGFQNDLKKAESLGIIRKDEASDEFVLNMDKVDGVVKQCMMSLF